MWEVQTVRTASTLVSSRRTLASTRRSTSRVIDGTTGVSGHRGGPQRRIHALLRRPKETVPEVLRADDIELDIPERRVTRGGSEISLTLKEFGLLEYFMRHPNTVVNREDLFNHLWDFNYESFSNVVDVHIKNLRKKLDANNGKSLFETVRGIGYRLHA